MTMQVHTAWFLAAALALVVAFVQWHFMSRLHHKRLAEERARHKRAQQAAAALLQGAHQQTATLQRELAAARGARKRVLTPAEPSVDDGAAARERLNRMLDEAPPTEFPVDGFAETRPSRHFAPSTTFGLLQRSTARAM